jgi:hypothetical protein
MPIKMPMIVERTITIENEEEDGFMYISSLNSVVDSELIFFTIGTITNSELGIMPLNDVE